MAEREPVVPFLGSGQHYFTDEGAADLEKLREIRGEPTEQLDQDMAATFSTQAGRRVMRWLEQQIFIEAGGFGSIVALGFENGVAAGFAIEGQRALLKEIKARIARATGKKD